MTWNLSELARMTGYDRRILEHWAELENDVLRPVPATKGATRRMFSEQEAIIACALRPLTYARIIAPILKDLAQAMRSAAKFSRTVGWTGDALMNDVITEALNDRPAWVHLEISQAPSGRPQISISTTIAANDGEMRHRPDDLDTKLRKIKDYPLISIDLRAALEPYRDARTAKGDEARP